MTRTIWQFRGDIRQKPSKELIDAAEGSPLVAKLLMNRGLTTPEAIRYFLDLESYQPTSGLELPDMDKALARIQKAIETQEHILVYGDFDVDGITGTSILYETLTFLKANVSYYIPDRAKEGHGLNTTACIRLASARKVKLVITTDTGITNFAEVSLMNGLGIDTVVTDHHELPENLPPSHANVNPKLLPDQTHPLAPLCGAGVAYKLCELLLDDAKETVGEEAAEDVKIRLLDLTAIGTVADLASLLQENRYLVYEGLKILNAKLRLGTNIIVQNAGLAPEATYTSETIAFTIAPRLNAIGRLDNATQAVELLTTKDSEKAREIAAFLEQLNRKRRELCDETFLEAERALHASGGLGERRAIVLGNPGWNLGVIGIVASRLIEKYHVPVFMMLLDEAEQIARCSARSIPGFHLHDELLACTDLFDGFGGHAGAGGFKLPLKNLNLFKDRIFQITERQITDEQMLPIVDVDDELDWTQINPHLVTLIQKMAPFGMDNPAPKFVVNNAHIMMQRNLGEGEKHLKLSIVNKDQKSMAAIDALYWNYGNKGKLDPQDTYRFAVSPELNTFNGNTKVQLIINDIKMAGEEGSTAKISAAKPKAAPVAEHAKQMTDVVPAAVQAEAPFVAALPEVKPAAVIFEEAALSATPAATAVLEKPKKAKSAAKTPPWEEPTSAGASLEKELAALDLKTTGLQWVDHRGREALDAFVGQLMMPLQDKRSVLIYHEGRKPNIPFLDESLLCGRQTLRSVDELIFWDFPPDRPTMESVLSATSPSVVHLVGGKFQSVPVFQPEKNYLTLLLQVLKKQPTAINPLQLASQLSLARPVIESTLVLLGRMGLIETEIAGLEPLQVNIQFPKSQPNMPALESLLEYAVFRQALSEMTTFRNWLLSANLESIRTQFPVS